MNAKLAKKALALMLCAAMSFGAMLVPASADVFTPGNDAAQGGASQTSEALAPGNAPIVDAAPVEAAPVEAAPVEAAPVEAALVEAALEEAVVDETAPSLSAPALSALAASSAASGELFVSPSGSDANDGTIERPLKTLKAARDAIRAAKAAEGLPIGGITVYLRGGEYIFDETLVLTAQDSGADGSPITYTPYNGEDARLIGAVSIPGAVFAPVSDPAALARLHPDVVGSGTSAVLSANLNDLGIPKTRWGRITRANPHYPNEPDMSSLYVNGTKQQISRWPNYGFALTGTIVKGQEGIPDNNTIWNDPTLAGAEFRYYQESGLPHAADRWALADQAWAAGYWFWDWYNDSMPVIADTANRTLTLGYASEHDIAAGKRYFVYNLLEEIDRPGEWFLDRVTGELYYYPAVSDMNTAAIQLATLEDTLIDITGSSYLNFAGITFEASAGAAFTMNGVENVSVTGGTIRNLGGKAADITSAKNTGFAGNNIYDLSKGGIYFHNSGNKLDFTPSGNYVRNNYISRFNLVSRTYCPAVEVSSQCVGIMVENNVIHDGPHSGLIVRGVDNVYRNNELYDLVYESDDAGAIYGGRNWTDISLVFDNNMLHDIQGMSGRNSAYGIYFDDNMGGEIVTSNIFYNVAVPVFGHGSWGNLVDSNIFVDCSRPVSLVNYNWNQSNQNLMVGHYNSVGRDNPAWNARYPEWTKIGDALAAMNPPGVGSSAYLNSSRDNVLTNNISYNAGTFNIGSTAQPTITNKDNVTLDNASAFKDHAARDYTLLSKPSGLGDDFAAPDYSSIGMYLDAYRNEIFVMDDFTLVFPFNGSTGVQAYGLNLMWNRAIGATAYNVTVAKDAAFTDVVLQTSTRATNVDVPGLQSAETKYYWKVEAVGTSNKNPVNRLNADGVYSFTTAMFESGDAAMLNALIASSEEYLAKAAVGSGTGEYPKRDCDSFAALIEEAKLLAAEAATTPQSLIDAMAARLQDGIKALEASRNVGIVDIGTLMAEGSEWRTSSSPSKYTLTPQGITFNGSRNGAHLGYQQKEMPNYAIWNFKMQLGQPGDSWAGQWFGISLRNGNTIADPWGPPNYLFGFKENQFELQKFGVRSAYGNTNLRPNDGIFELGKEYDIQIAVLDIAGGARCVMLVDGQLIYDFEDLYVEGSNEIPAVGFMGFHLYGVLGSMDLVIKPSAAAINPFDPYPYEVTNLKELMLNTGKWATHNVSDAFTITPDQMTINRTSGSLSGNGGRVYYDDLLPSGKVWAFNMNVPYMDSGKNFGFWVRSAEKGRQGVESWDCDLYFFRWLSGPARFEIQRTNGGTYVETSLGRVDDTGFSLMAPGRECEMVIGAIDVPSGVRLIWYIDGVKVFDIVDAGNDHPTRGYLPPITRSEGYFTIYFAGYNPQDTIRVYPADLARYPMGDEPPIPPEPDEGTLYVSPSGGDDANEGSIDSPLATIRAARDKIRAMSELPDGGVTVYLRGGEYAFTEQLEFTAADSGGADGKPITYKAYEGEQPKLTGSVNLPGSAFVPVTDQAIINRLHPKAVGYVLQLDLNALGVPSSRWGAISNTNPITAALYVDAVGQTLARWPNQGYEATGTIVPGGTGTAFSYAEYAELDYDPDRWALANQAWTFGYWSQDWSIEARRLTVDTAARTLRVTGSTSRDRRFFAYNLLEEIDLPGEWFLDRNTGMLYYYPTVDDLSDSNIQFATYEGNMVRVNGASNLTFSGLTLEASAGRAFLIENADSVTVADSTLRNLGGKAADVNRCTNTGFDGCDFYDLYTGGVNFGASGSKQNLTPSGNFVTNCYFSRFNLVYRTYNPAVEVSSDAVGVYVGNNVIHDGPHSGLLIRGVDNVYENNELYNLVHETDDAGAIYGGRNWTDISLVFHNNLFHDINGMSGKSQAYGIYLDDNMGGEIMTSNMFYDVAVPIFGHGSWGNTIDSNVFANCGTTAFMHELVVNNQGRLRDTYNTIGDSNPVWNERFTFWPSFAALMLSDEWTGPTAANKDYILNTSRDNVLTNNVSFNSTNEPDKAGAKLVDGMFWMHEDPVARNMVIQNNVLVDSLDVFKDPAANDYSLKSAPPGTDGFVNPDFGAVGLYLDENRSKIFVMQDFDLVYPPKGAEGMQAYKLNLQWNRAIGATEYNVTLAKDAAFSDVVFEATTRGVFIETDNLEYGMTTYYWKVEAVCMSAKTPARADNSNGVFSFTTAAEEIGDATLLAIQIDISEAYLDSIESDGLIGDDIGNYPQAEVDAFIETLDEAKELYERAAASSVPQSVIDAMASRLEAGRKRLEASRVSGLVDLGTLMVPGSVWNSNMNTGAGGRLEVTPEGIFYNGRRDGAHLGYEMNELPNYAIWTFKMQLGKEGDPWNTQWGAISLRSSRTIGDPWTATTYLFGFKEDVFELQKFRVPTTLPNGGNYQVPNNGIFQLGKVHEIQVAALDTPNGARLIMKVDGQVIYDYLDVESASNGIPSSGYMGFHWYGSLGSLDLQIFPAGIGGGNEEADKSQLAALVEKADTYAVGAFTADTAAAFAEALADAKGALASNAATQADVDAAHAALLAAIAGLKIDTANPAVAPAAELLRLLLDIATLDEADYAPGAWANLMAVVNDAWALVRMLLA